MASMAARLSQVEKLNQVQVSKLAKQAQEIDALRAENRKLRLAAPEEDSDEASSASTRPTRQQLQLLREERDFFCRQVEQMSKFLDDYGLTWVGDGSDSDGGDGEAQSAAPPAHEEVCEGAAVRPERYGKAPLSPSSGANNGSPARLPQSGLTVDIQFMMSRVESLNAMVEQEGARIVTGPHGARLVAQDALPLPVTFFHDGVKLADRPFQVYDLRPTQLLIRDILDGFFPYVLKEEFPDGVKLKVVDRTAFDFAVWLKDGSRGDPDLVDGGDRLALAGGRAFRPTGAGGVAERFLSKLPEKVVRGGRICEVRGPLQQQLREGRKGSCVEPAGEVSLLGAGRDVSDPVARLQVKLEGGRRLILSMEPWHTIEKLEDALEQWLVSSGLPPLIRGSLRTAFPPRTYTNRGQTMTEAGLTPTATLFVGGDESGSARQGVTEVRV